MPVLNRAAKALKHPVFQTVARVADELGLDTYVIGGYVRDALLERGNAKDIDFVAVGSGIELAKAVAQNLPNRPKVQIFKNYGKQIQIISAKALIFCVTNDRSF